MDYKIVKIHGCSGAGKTTLVREILRLAGNVYPIRGTSDKVEAYRCVFNDPVYVLGSYENNCGGMDTVSSADAAMRLVHAYSNQGHVIHEGLLQSTYYGKMGTDSKQYGDRYIYAFMDTDVETCIERVAARRAVNGSKNKFNPQLTRDKHSTIERLRMRLPSMGHTPVVLHGGSSCADQVLKLLGV